MLVKLFGFISSAFFIFIYLFIYYSNYLAWTPWKKWSSIHDLKSDGQVEKFNSKSSLFPED